MRGCDVEVRNVGLVHAANSDLHLLSIFGKGLSIVGALVPGKVRELAPGPVLTAKLRMVGLTA